MNDMVIYADQPLSAAAMRANVNLIQEVMQAVMKPDVHFGKIPGTPKPTLYKAGAEKIAQAFRIAPSYRTEDLSTPDCVRYRVTCIGTHQTSSIVMGEGMGECSSLEEKYKWRKAYPKEFAAAPEDRKRVKYGKDFETQQIRTEPADVANTILKMACKRAQVAMTLNVTAASDIFTQDIEDLPEELRHDDEGAGSVLPLDPKVKADFEAAIESETDAAKLGETWKKIVAACNEAKDKAAYNDFKGKVIAKGEALKGA